MSAAVFVGRSEEVARGQTAVEAASRGEGALLLFSGEPGIGKTRLADAVASVAAERGARVAWGRCWEAGGAPAYWPWIQIFRALGVEADPFVDDAHVSGADIQHVRFRQFDRAVAQLTTLARDDLLVLVLDDVHMADVPSLLLLHFLARSVRGARLIVLATYRDAEARLSPEVGSLLAKIEREGTAIALRRLSREDILAWMREELPDADASAAERVYRTTEGNALFVHELLRVRGTPADGEMPDGLRAVLDEHLAKTGPDVRATLEAASVLGREIDARSVAAISGLPLGTVSGRLRIAHEAGILGSPAGGDRLAFAHILLRERLYASLDEIRRAELHVRAGEHVVATRGDLTTAAHHFVEGRAVGSTARAARALLDAARGANARLAFEDASRLSARGLELLEGQHGSEESTLACDLLLLLGEARMHAGERASGKQACMAAIEKAKAIGAGPRQARAALVYATELVTGAVDETMVRLLTDALAALPEEDSPIRARTSARLAAALVPPSDPESVPAILERARASIAMAERLGDPDTLLYALKFGGSAQGYIIPQAERVAIAERMMELVDELGRPIEIINSAGYSMVILRETGRIEEYEACIARFERVLEDFPQPHYRWRLPMMKSQRALFAGDFEGAERLGAEALAIDSESPMCRAHWGLHRIALAHARGDSLAEMADMDRAFSPLSRIPGINAFRAWYDAAQGRTDEARRQIQEITEIRTSYPWALIASEVVCLMGDRELAAAIYPVLRAFVPTQPAFWGPNGTFFFGPTARIAARLAEMIDAREDARAHYEASIQLCERMQAKPFVELSRKGLDSLGGIRAPASKRPEAIALTRDGDVWQITSSTGATFRIKDAKGVQYLADLVARPGEDLHVTQLAELADGVSGDAGPVLDARAKAAYKERLEELRDDLEEATQFGDSGRAERAQAEIDAIADQLAAAVGIGGRDRKVGSHVERARINVQRRLRDAIARIAEHDPVLGKYLSAAVKTGTYCSFSPF